MKASLSDSSNFLTSSLGSSPSNVFVPSRSFSGEHVLLGGFKRLLNTAAGFMCCWLAEDYCECDCCFLCGYWRLDYWFNESMRPGTACCALLRFWELDRGGVGPYGVINFERAERPLDRGLIVVKVADLFLARRGVLPFPPVFFIIMSWVRSSDVELSMAYCGILSCGVTLALFIVGSYGSV